MGYLQGHHGQVGNNLIFCPGEVFNKVQSAADKNQCLISIQMRE